MTYTIKEFSQLSRFDGTRLQGMCVAPEQPLAIVQMAHGMAEHKERYLPFMEYLAARGFACFLHDHRGHGGSVEGPEKLGWFGTNGAEGLVKDLRQMVDYAKSQYPGLPLYLFGQAEIQPGKLSGHRSAGRTVLSCGDQNLSAVKTMNCTAVHKA